MILLLECAHFLQCQTLCHVHCRSHANANPTMTAHGFLRFFDRKHCLTSCCPIAPQSVVYMSHILIGNRLTCPLHLIPQQLFQSYCLGAVSAWPRSAEIRASVCGYEPQIHRIACEGEIITECGSFHEREQPVSLPTVSLSKSTVVEHNKDVLVYSTRQLKDANSAYLVNALHISINNLHIASRLHTTCMAWPQFGIGQYFIQFCG